MKQTLFVFLCLSLLQGLKAEKLECRADIAFVVDSSSSIHEDDFKLQIAFIRNLVSKFKIGPDYVQISALSYGRRVFDEFTFNKYRDEAGVLSGVNKISYKEQTATRTYAAIKRMRDHLFAKGNGVRKDALHVGVVLTDGTTNPGGVELWTAPRGKAETQREAEMTRGNGTFLFAIGIGDKVDKTELEGIATDPDKTSVIMVQSYKELNSDFVKNTLMYRACFAPTTPSVPVTTPAPTTTSERPPGESANEVCQGKAADVIFILDESTSIHNRSNFRKELTFVSNTIDYFDLSPGKTQIGVIAFSTNARMIFHLNQYSNKKQVQNAVMRIRMKGGSTYTEKALKMLLDEGFSSAHGARPGIAQIAVIVTDGNPTDRYSSWDMSTKVLATGINVFAIGIGDVSMSELQRLASKPSSKYVFSVDNLGALNTLKETLAYKTCKEQKDKPSPNVACKHKIADIVIVADASTSIGQANFTHQLEFIGDLVDIFDIGPSATRVGLITFSTDPHIQFDMKTHSTKAGLKKALKRVPWATGLYVRSTAKVIYGREKLRKKEKPGNTYTHKALDTMLKSGFNKKLDIPGRKAPKIGIVITDGASTNPTKTRKMAAAVHKKGITMFSIGVGRKIVEDELNIIASDPNSKFSFMVDNYASLKSIRNMLATVTCTRLYVRSTAKVIYGREKLREKEKLGLYVRSTAKVIYGREKLRKKEKPGAEENRKNGRPRSAGTFDSELDEDESLLDILRQDVD